MRIAVIGYGYVGKAMTELLSSRHDVVIKDVDGSYLEVNQCDIGVVCVPTPSGEEWSCDTSIVEEVVRDCKITNLLIKSTVPPETCKYLESEYKKNVVFSPEYIGEGNYPVPYWKYPHPTDMSLHDFCVLGGNKKTTSLMVDVLKNCYGPQCRFFQTDHTTAEIIKYMENAWLATKITFCNEFAKISNIFDCDYNEVREGWLLDGRIERSHTVVNNGYNGKCLPKDVWGIIMACHSKNLQLPLLNGVVNGNERYSNANL